MGCSIPACAECDKKCSLMHGKDCAECGQKCLLIHGKDWDESSIVTSFFRIMKGDDFSEVMILPSKFERIAPYFKDQKKEQMKQFLEDSSGKRWSVTLSKSNGLWAFQEGWSAFSADHRLKVGDVMMFHYIKGHHFVVQIFGRHGFEKHRYAKLQGSGKKTPKSSSKFVAENIEKPSTPTNDSRKKQTSGNSAQSGSNTEPIRSEQVAADKIPDTTGGVGREAQVQETPCKEELVYMMNRDQDYEQEDRCMKLYDLSNFEKLKSKDADGERVADNKGSPCIGSVDPTSQVMMEDVPKLVEAECFAASTSSRHPTSDSTDSQEKTNKKLSSKDRPPKLVKEKTSMVHDNRSAQQKSAPVPKPRVLNFKDPNKTLNNGFYGKVHMVKREPVENILKGEAIRPAKKLKVFAPVKKEGNTSREPDVNNRIPVLKPVKPEPVDTDDREEEELPIPPAPVTKQPDWSLKVVVSSLFYLESPVRFPCASSRGRPPKLLQRIVILVDPKCRPWEVMYHEQHNFRLITSGWKGFCQANGVKVGDVCCFRLEEGSKYQEGNKLTYGVTITPK